MAVHGMPSNFRSFCPLFAGCTPLILAATAGHASTVEILLDHGAEIEAQSDRTKDTALSLACSGGRQEVSVSSQGFDVTCEITNTLTTICIIFIYLSICSFFISYYTGFSHGTKII